MNKKDKKLLKEGEQFINKGGWIIGCCVFIVMELLFYTRIIESHINYTANYSNIPISKSDSSMLFGVWTLINAFMSFGIGLFFWRLAAYTIWSFFILPEKMK